MSAVITFGIYVSQEEFDTFPGDFRLGEQSLVYAGTTTIPKEKLPIEMRNTVEQKNKKNK